LKAILEYDLDNPDDREAHLRAIKSLDMASVIFEFQINSRKRIAQKIYDNKDGNITSLDIIYNEFFELLENHNININELIS
jgi:hypothetical protein